MSHPYQYGAQSSLGNLSPTPVGTRHKRARSRSSRVHDASSNKRYKLTSPPATPPSSLYANVRQCRKVPEPLERRPPMTPGVQMDFSQAHISSGGHVGCFNRVGDVYNNSNSFSNSFEKIHTVNGGFTQGNGRIFLDHNDGVSSRSANTRYATFGDETTSLYNTALRPYMDSPSATTEGSSAIGFFTTSHNGFNERSPTSSKTQAVASRQSHITPTKVVLPSISSLLHAKAEKPPYLINRPNDGISGAAYGPYDLGQSLGNPQVQKESIISNQFGHIGKINGGFVQGNGTFNINNNGSFSNPDGCSSDQSVEDFEILLGLDSARMYTRKHRRHDCYEGFIGQADTGAAQDFIVFTDVEELGRPLTGSCRDTTALYDDDNTPSLDGYHGHEIRTKSRVSNSFGSVGVINGGFLQGSGTFNIGNNGVYSGGVEQRQHERQSYATGTAYAMQNNMYKR